MKEPIQCIVIDDEPLARKGLIEYIGDVDFLQFKGEFENPLQASQLIQTGFVQLIFLDIQMPKITGIDFLKSLPQAPPVIFTTAFPQHALEGYELNALDYLVKPISFERFYKASLRAKEYYEVRQKNVAERIKEPNEIYFFIKSDNKLVKVFYEEILFIEAMQNYAAIHTINIKLITYLTFKSIEDYLPQESFIRTHKSYIVAASRIDHIEGNNIRIGAHHIPISRSNREEVMEKLLKGRYLKR